MIQPDLIGYGVSWERTQQYIDADLNGSAIAYSVVAAQQYQTWSQTRDKYGFNLSSSATIINSGASQGATSALSGTYYMENKLDKEKYSIPEISETRICAGAYNMEKCMNEFCDADTLVYACKLPMIIAGAVTDYSYVLGDYSVHDFFAEKMKNFVYTDPDTKETCGTIWQMLDRKAYSSEVIEHALMEACPSETSVQTSFHKLLASDLFDEDGNLNWENPKMAVLKKFCDMTNFSSTDMWTPQSPIYMLHGTNDAIVPYSISEEFYNNQNTHDPFEGDKITFTTLEDVPDMGRGATGSHLITCVIWYLSEITGMSAKVLNAMFKLM